jgi:hypothetical protein
MCWDKLLSRANPPQPLEPSLAVRAGPPPQNRSGVEPAVEDVLHLSDVAIVVPLEAEVQAGARARRLDVSQHRVDGPQPWLTMAALPRAPRFLAHATFVLLSESTEPIVRRRVREPARLHARRMKLAAQYQPACSRVSHGQGLRWMSRSVACTTHQHRTSQRCIYLRRELCSDE